MSSLATLASSVALIDCVPVMAESPIRIPAFLLERRSLTHWPCSRTGKNKSATNDAHGISLMTPPLILIIRILVCQLSLLRLAGITLLVVQPFNRIGAGRAYGWNHSTDQSHYREDRGGNKHAGG